MSANKIGPRELELRKMREQQAENQEKQAKAEKKAAKAKPKKDKPKPEAEPMVEAAGAEPIVGAVASTDETVHQSTIAQEPEPSSSEQESVMAKKPAKKAKAKSNGKGNGARKGTKSAMVEALLLRSSGCTGKEVLSATGWPTVSMPAIAKSLGLKLRKEKTESGLRYYGSKSK